MRSQLAAETMADMDSIAAAALFGAVGAVVGSVLTTLGAVLTGRWTTKAMEKQLAATVAEAERARQAAQAEAWRQHKHAVYREVMQRIQQWSRSPHRPTEEMGEIVAALDQLIADASLMGGPVVAAVCSGLQGAVDGYAMRLSAAPDPGDPDYVGYQVVVQKDWEELQAAGTRFRAAARVDLGIDPSV